MILEGLIDRRILVNVRLRLDVAESIVPPPFRPQLVRGWAVAGVCLIRLRQIRPQGMPAYFGVSSENAAHRIAVEWEHQGQTLHGVYIPRRDTGSRINALAGGRLFPGLHHLRRFSAKEQGGRFQIRIEGEGSSPPILELAVAKSTQHQSQLFGSVEAAREFFRQGAVGYSPSNNEREFDGIELRASNWALTPLSVNHFHSQFLEEMTGIRSASDVDSAYLMEHVAHSWHPLPAVHAPRELRLVDDITRDHTAQIGELSHAS